MLESPLAQRCRPLATADRTTAILQGKQQISRLEVLQSIQQGYECIDWQAGIYGMVVQDKAQNVLLFQNHLRQLAKNISDQYELVQLSTTSEIRHLKWHSNVSLQMH